MCCILRRTRTRSRRVGTPEHAAPRSDRVPPGLRGPVARRRSARIVGERAFPPPQSQRRRSGRACPWGAAGRGPRRRRDRTGRRLATAAVAFGGDRRRAGDPGSAAGVAAILRPLRRRPLGPCGIRRRRRRFRPDPHTAGRAAGMTTDADGDAPDRGGRGISRFGNPYLLLAAAALLWSGNHIVGRAIGGHVPPIGVSTIRWLIPAILLWPWVAPHLKRDWPAIRAHWAAMLWLGATGGALFTALQYVGLQYTSALNVSVLNSLVPVLIVATSAALFRDRISPMQLAGIVVRSEEHTSELQSRSD